MNKKGFINIAVIVVLVLVIGAISFNRGDLKLSLTGDFVVPEYVDVFLTSNVDGGGRIPVLILSAIAGGGCDFASDLDIKKSVDGNRMVIDIEGYKFTKGFGETCPAVI